MDQKSNNIILDGFHPAVSNGKMILEVGSVYIFHYLREDSHAEFWDRNSKNFVQVYTGTILTCLSCEKDEYDITRGCIDFWANNKILHYSIALDRGPYYYYNYFKKIA